MNHHSLCGHANWFFIYLLFLQRIFYNSATSLSIMISPSPGPARVILVTKSATALMPSTCSSRNPSRKSVMLPSSLTPANAWRSMIDWLTVFSNSKAAFIASKGDPHSSFAGQRVEVDDRLVDGLFQLQGGLHRVQGGSPFVVLRPRDVLQDDATTARVLELHELLCVFRFFGRCLLEVLGESRQSDVIPIEVQRHRQVNVVGVKLHVHLLVDASFAFLMVVLTNDGCHFVSLLV